MDYYTYAYLREDGTPYYIGKGRGRRAYESYGRTFKPPKDRSRIIILKQNLTEEEAFKHEIYMIAVFGRKNIGTGILRNLTDGGEGTSGSIPWNKGKTGIFNGEKNPMYGKKGPEHPAFGYKRTDESRRKQSERQIGEKNPMHGKTGRNNPNYGSKRSEETKMKLSESRKGEKNHRYGKKSWNNGKSVMIWITNGSESKHIFKTEEIPEGWYRGRTVLRKTKMMWITNGIENKQVPITEKVPEGWNNGLTIKKTERIWITNGVESKRIPVTEGIPDGWYNGITRGTNK